jgi:hypothetical protein
MGYINISTSFTLKKLSKLTDNSKLYLYNKIKHDIVLEEYLIKEKNFKNRQLIDLLTLRDSLINGFILLVFILTKYIIT